MKADDPKIPGQLQCSIATAAQEHGENDDPEHQIGDLEDALLVALRIIAEAGKIKDFKKALAEEFDGIDGYEFLLEEG